MNQERSTEESQAMSRREYRMWLHRRAKRLRRRRRRRIRRIRFWRSVQTIGFWLNATIGFVCLLAFIFWAKFAFVYDIPTYADQGALQNIDAYITVKPWWFGPPMFDLTSYLQGGEEHIDVLNDPYFYLLLRLGSYDDIVLNPKFIWVMKSNS